MSILINIKTSIESHKEILKLAEVSEACRMLKPGGPYYLSFIINVKFDREKEAAINLHAKAVWRSEVKNVECMLHRYYKQSLKDWDSPIISTTNFENKVCSAWYEVLGKLDDDAHSFL